MIDIIETLMEISFVIFGVSLLLSFFTHAIYIRPVALKLKKNKGILSKFLWFSGEELSDYWGLSKIC